MGKTATIAAKHSGCYLGKIKYMNYGSTCTSFSVIGASYDVTSAGIREFLNCETRITFHNRARVPGTLNDYKLPAKDVALPESELPAIMCGISNLPGFVCFYACHSSIVTASLSIAPTWPAGASWAVVWTDAIMPVQAALVQMRMDWTPRFTDHMWTHYNIIISQLGSLTVKYTIPNLGAAGIMSEQTLTTMFYPKVLRSATA
ncbi:hypothetical protein HOY80DRAFT_1082581 [Tuber brumale]|nr:hypothetical protein HOY80DRAFT_1082581 [Tuber brumale]